MFRVPNLFQLPTLLGFAHNTLANIVCGVEGFDVGIPTFGEAKLNDGLFALPTLFLHTPLLVDSK